MMRSAFYLITLSARASTLGGIVRPICFAVLRLISSSNCVGCCTGRSGLRSFQDLVHVPRYAPVGVREISPVGHEPAESTAGLPFVH